MRKLTKKSTKRSFTTKSPKRKPGNMAGTWIEYAPGDPSSWVIVGSPDVTLDDILGTLDSNVIGS
jgi:hypothetical protein